MDRMGGDECECGTERIEVQETITWSKNSSPRVNRIRAWLGIGLFCSVAVRRRDMRARRTAVYTRSSSLLEGVSEYLMTIDTWAVV